jgi:eukaryotic-like serine/threonine-protein kinase
VGRYALFHQIASGGMATVRLGRLVGPAGFSRTVAVKCLYPQYASDPDFISMFLDEARLVARIRSPYVVPMLDVVVLDAELFIVMEYVPGESLVRLIRPAQAAGPTMPLDVAVAVMQGTLEGLHAAHEARTEQGTPLGIVHRDVSPQNILVGTDGLPHLIDFGVAKAAGRLQTTRDGQIKGKLAYMAPEQLRGDEITRRVDVYAASVVLWEMLTGTRLFHGNDEGATVTRVLMGEVVPPGEAFGGRLDDEARQVMDRLDAVVMRGLDRSPARRFETARDMAAELGKCVTPASPSAVSAWLERAAHESLAARVALVTSIESGTATVPEADIVSHVTARRNELRAVGVDVAIPPQATQASTISTVSDVRSGSAKSRRRWRLAASLGIGCVAVVTTAVVVLRPSNVQPGAAATSAATDHQAPAALAGDDGAAPTSSGDAAAPVDSSSSAASPVAATVSAPSRPPARPPKHSARPPSNCDPPYTWDAQGKKHYKAECL